MKIGILALQGDAREHFSMLKKCKAEPILVKLPSDMKEISGLIIPGGESTTIGILMKKYSLDKVIIERAKQGMAIYGTCAGVILLAKDIIGSTQPRLGLFDITIKRNEYGRQIDSFEADLDVSGFNKPFHAVFIRAPVIEKISNGIDVLARFNGKPVLARYKNILVSTFHPELTDDKRVHEYFIGMLG